MQWTQDLLNGKKISSKKRGQNGFQDLECDQFYIVVRIKMTFRRTEPKSKEIFQVFIYSYFFSFEKTCTFDIL